MIAEMESPPTGTDGPCAESELDPDALKEPH
jgi:hypothetical protein